MNLDSPLFDELCTSPKQHLFARTILSDSSLWAHKKSCLFVDASSDQKFRSRALDLWDADTDDSVSVTLRCRSRSLDLWDADTDDSVFRHIKCRSRWLDLWDADTDSSVFRHIMKFAPPKINTFSLNLLQIFPRQELNFYPFFLGKKVPSALAGFMGCRYGFFCFCNIFITKRGFATPPITDGTTPI